MPKEITDADRVDRVHRRTMPTAAFSLRVLHVRWIEAEAERRGISKSEVVRDALDRAMTTTDTDMRAA